MAEAQRTQYGRERDEWHKQEEALRAELAEARQRGGYREHVAAGGELRELGLNEEELRKIQSEVASQERLIAGYQTENERLTTQVRTLNERLRTEVGARDENVRRLELRCSELEATSAERADEGLIVQLDDARRRLRAAEEAATTGPSERELELRMEIDRLRVAKREVEAKQQREEEELQRAIAESQHAVQPPARPARSREEDEGRAATGGN